MTVFAGYRILLAIETLCLSLILPCPVQYVRFLSSKFCSVNGSLMTEFFNTVSFQLLHLRERPFYFKNYLSSKSSILENYIVRLRNSAAKFCSDTAKEKDFEQRHDGFSIEFTLHVTRSHHH